MPHIHDEPGQFDHAVEVFVVCKGKVLFRKHEKYHLWLGVGGHIELDEDPNQAAIREVKEEVGLDVKLWSPVQLPDVGVGDIELVPPAFLNRHSISDTHSHIANVYFATSPNQNVIPEFENDEWRWLSREEVEKNELGMKPNIRHYARAALDAIGGKEQRPKVGIGVTIIKDGKMLLGKRINAHGEGEYASPGGHLEFGESIEDCARRETREEAGIEIENIRFQYLANVKKYDGKHYVHIGLITDWKSGEPKVLEPEKCEGWGWYDMDNLPEPLFEMTRLTLESYRSGQNYFDS